MGFRNFDAIYGTRPIDNGTDFLPLVDDPQDFSGITYEVEGTSHTLDHYLETFFIAGILVAKGDRVLLERYRLGHSETSRWVSYSVAKSVTSLLIGAAIKDGYIESLDEPVTDYLPRLKGSAYDRTTIRHLLHMASGVAWNESYTDPNSDVALAEAANGTVRFDYLAAAAAGALAAAVPGVLHPARATRPAMVRPCRHLRGGGVHQRRARAMGTRVEPPNGHPTAPTAAWRFGMKFSLRDLRDVICRITVK